MKKKPTDQLMDTLKSSLSIENYIHTEKEHFINSNIADYLNELIITKSLKKSQVIRDAELHEIYGYQIFSGTRTPSRDKLIALSFGMQLSLDEVQRLLKYAGVASLYLKNARDSIIIWGISHTLTICATNELLYNHSFNTL